MKKIVFLLLLFSLTGWTKTLVNKVTEIASSSSTKIKVNLSDYVSENPAMKFKGKEIHLIVPNAVVGPEVRYHIKNKDNIQVSQEGNDLLISVRPGYNAKRLSSQINVSLIDKNIVLKMPLLKTLSFAKTPKVVKREKEIFTPVQKLPEVKKESFLSNDVASSDEDRLKYLVEDFEKKESKKLDFSSAPVEDEVKTKLGANNKPQAPMKLQGKKDFELYSYVLKVVGVLVAIIAIFFLCVNFFRKKVLNRSKLSFLGNDKLVDIISTTYISPKKNLLLVKVHEQFLLLSNSENSIHFITEIKDPNGFLKMGEKALTGDNFDTNLEISNEIKNLDSSVKLKKESEIFQSTPTDLKSKKFSEHIKKKVKKLRPMQQP